MSIVIVGGHDRMVSQYKEICKKYKCKVKIFTHLPSDFRCKICKADLLVFFTNTVSHSMISCAMQEAIKNNIKIARSHTSSSCALKKILDCHCC